MNVHPDINFQELARSTDDFNGAQLKAVCVEAGMLALRRDATEVCFHSNMQLNSLKIMTDCVTLLRCHFSLDLNFSSVFF